MEKRNVFAAVRKSSCALLTSEIDYKQLTSEKI